MKRFTVKRLDDGRAMVNLGYGTLTCLDWNNVDFSNYARFGRFSKVAGFLGCVSLISNGCFRHFEKVDRSIIVWDLRKGVPSENEASDVVYHFHFLEHINREEGLSLLKENYHVLKWGIIRVVVPNLEKLTENYVQSL